MNKISCNTIRDILPLYVDEVVSEDTRTMVVEHLGQCAECRKQYENMKTKVVVPVEDDIKPLKRFKTAWKKKKIFSSSGKKEKNPLRTGNHGRRIRTFHEPYIESGTKSRFCPRA